MQKTQMTFQESSKLISLLYELRVQNSQKFENFLRTALGFELLYREPNQKRAFFATPQGSRDLLVSVTEDAATPSVFSPEHLLIFYIHDTAALGTAYDRLEMACTKVQSHNPYWVKNGIEFLHESGLRIILSPSTFFNFRARLACPLGSLAGVSTFLQSRWGLREIGAFQNHADFDGIMLAGGDLDIHLEFTFERGNEAVNISAGQVPGTGLIFAGQPPSPRFFEAPGARITAYGSDDFTLWANSGTTLDKSI